MRGNINWPAVAEKYDGIIIAPYIWQRRLSDNPDHFWYYGWDCASGCIWNTEVIEEIHTKELVANAQDS